MLVKVAIRIDGTHIDVTCLNEFYTFVNYPVNFK